VVKTALKMARGITRKQNITTMQVSILYALEDPLPSITCTNLASPAVAIRTLVLNERSLPPSRSLPHHFSPFRGDCGSAALPISSSLPTSDHTSPWADTFSCRGPSITPCSSFSLSENVS
jgi:hypothetical protein